MPPTPAHHRPQTLKQAKKAYRKSGATVRLSESELAIIERRGVLQERADRIKDREARRKANIKRKEERNQREQDARQRMGIAEPMKEGKHVGPSQLHLGAFMAVETKRKRDDEPAELTRAEREFFATVDSKQCHPLSISKTPWRNPLQPIAANTVPLHRQSTYATKSKEMDLREPESSSECPPLSRSPPQPIPAKGSSHQKSPSEIEALETSNEEDSVPLRCQIATMGTPPPRMPLQTESTASDAKQKPSAITPQDKPPESVEECWDDFFVSSTQIARELSPPPTRLPVIQRITKPSPQPRITLPTAPKDDSSGLLHQISTQDLDFTGQLTQAAPLVVTEDTDFLLAQISTQDLDFSGDLTQVAPKAPKTDTSDFDEDLTEEDLGDVALELELESLATSRTATLSPQRPKTKCGYGDQKESRHGNTPIKTKFKSSRPDSETKAFKREDSAHSNADDDDNDDNDDDDNNNSNVNIFNSYDDDLNNNYGFDPLEAYMAGDLGHNHWNHIINHATDHTAHDLWFGSDEYKFKEKIAKPPVMKTKPSTTDTKPAALDIKPPLLDTKFPLHQPPYQDTKLPTESDVFDLDLSTQDLRDLEC